ncbi:MAG: hypothetical protein AAGF84_09055 [Planctomycetota bacterium]
MSVTPPNNPNPHPTPGDADPAMDAMLDEALAPTRDDWSDTARDRTLAAMLDAAGSTHGQPAETPVIGRIGPDGAGLRWGVGFAAAAVLALAGAVVAITLLGDPADVGNDAPIAQTKTNPESEAAQGALAMNTPNDGEAFETDLEAQLAAELDAWSAAAQGTGLAADTLATASATSNDWWNNDPTADAYGSALDPDALRQQLDAFNTSADLIF